VLVAQLVGGVAKRHNDHRTVATSPSGVRGQLELLCAFAVLPGVSNNHAQMKSRSGFDRIILGCGRH
jgi:hypothetical protein